MRMSRSLESDREREAANVLRNELQSSTPSRAFRAVAATFGLDRYALAFLATHLYSNILTPEVQAIWHWDRNHKGAGHTDEELDALLSHLVLVAEPRSAV